MTTFSLLFIQNWYWILVLVFLQIEDHYGLKLIESNFWNWENVPWLYVGQVEIHEHSTSLFFLLIQPTIMKDFLNIKISIVTLVIFNETLNKDQKFKTFEKWSHFNGFWIKMTKHFPILPFIILVICWHFFQSVAVETFINKIGRKIFISFLF